jgi:hypothetical protein
MGIGLVTNVPDQKVIRSLEDIVKCYGQFDHPETRSEMPFLGGYDIDYKGPEF